MSALHTAVQSHVATEQSGISEVVVGMLQPTASPGQRLIAGAFAGEGVTLQWSADKVADLRRIAVEMANDMRQHAFAAIQLDTLEGNLASARARIGKLVDDVAVLYPQDDVTLEGLLVVSILSGQWDVIPRLLHARFGVDWCAGVDVEDAAPPGQSVRWEIDTAGKSLFHFNKWMFSRDNTWNLLLGWTRSLSLFYDYTTAANPERGSVIVSIGDGGSAPGLAPSEHRRGYYLIPDSHFLHTYGYADMRVASEASRVAWSDRRPIAFWRGSSTGQWRYPHWQKLPRIQLCQIAKLRAASGLLDAAITSLACLPPEIIREAETEGLLGGFAKQRDFMKYKYQIDVDGNTNAWSALFQKLLTGSPVLKVRSPLDYRQWYYDDLIPWFNYVPVEADMGDLIEKIVWLRAHDDEAQRIGERGLKLARGLTHAREITRARATISAAIRHFSGRPEVAVPFDEECSEARFLVEGWSGIVVNSSGAGRYPLAPESRIRFPRPVTEGDLELRLTLATDRAAAVSPFRVITTANGVLVGDTVVAPTEDVVVRVRAAVLARSRQTSISLSFPNPMDAVPALPPGVLGCAALFTGLYMGPAALW